VRRLPFVCADDLEAAANATRQTLKADGVVLLPTETLYGLACAPDSETAITRVCHLKGRPSRMALPVLCADWEQLRNLVEVPQRYQARLDQLWPGPLTAVLPSKRRLAATPSSTLAVRIPGLPLLCALLSQVGPLTGTSANLHGTPPSTQVARALDSLLQPPDLVLDGGLIQGGQASTLVDLSTASPTVLRPGPVEWM